MRYVIAAATAASVVAIAGAGQAQDRTWTGPYLGAQVGWGWQPKNQNESILFDTNRDGAFDNTVNTTTGANAFAPGFCNGAARTATPAGGCEKDDDGFEFGARAGYDWQIGAFVVGGVAEFSRTDVQDAASAFSTTPAFYTMDRTLQQVGAVRARAGFAMPETLIYATGGVARGKIKHRFNTSNTVNTFPRVEDKWSNGYQYGGGVERRVATNLSLGLEYIYTQLDDDDFRVRAVGPAAATNPFLLVNSGGTDFRRSEEDFATHSVRMTMNYRF